MKHQQILDKLAARFLVQALDENFARLISWSMLGRKFNTESESAIWQKIYNRWDCVLKENNTDEVSDLYKQKTMLAMAIIGHKYGLSIDAIQSQAFEAIDALNNQVALSDDFYRQTQKIKDFLKTEPVPLKRRPSQPANITFFRPQDVIAIQYKKRFYAAYVHGDTGINESPIIEFYDAIFEKEPTFDELKNLPARGSRYQDGTVRVTRYAVSQLTYLPDPANQVKLIKAAVDVSPKTDHLSEAIGAYRLSDIFTLQRDIEDLFEY